MKWSSLVVAILMILLWISLPVIVTADTSVFVTVTMQPPGSNAPTNFTVTYINPTKVHLAWAKGAGTTTTVIRGKFGGYPADINDGYSVYSDSGTSTNDVSVDYLSSWSGTWFYRAWGYNSETGYSGTYAQGNMENMMLLELLIIIVLNVFVFWPKRWTKPEAVFLNIVASPFNFMYGFNLASGNTLYSILWVEGTGFIILGAFCLVRSILMLFAENKRETTE